MKLLVCALSSLPVLGGFLGGCATVTRGTTNQVQIHSEPSEANVRTSLNQTCRTPCTLQVSRKDQFSVIVSKPGYKPQTTFVRTQIAGSGAAGFAGNVIIGGVVGMGVDAVTGATLEHVPNPVSVVLEPDEGALSAGGGVSRQGGNSRSRTRPRRTGPVSALPQPTRRKLALHRN